MMINRTRVPTYPESVLSSEERAFRLQTTNQRVLPNFIVIGAQKCGTTSLYRYLGQHPQITMSAIKQVRYFDGGLDPKIDNYTRGIDWYRSFFPLEPELEEIGGITGEASPMYLFHPFAAERIRRLLPEIKLIVLLRSPPQRAISQYYHALRAQEEDLPLMEALQSEELRLRHSFETEDYRSFSFVRHSYKSRGVYHTQLDRYFDKFPAENILVLKFEDFFQNLDKGLSRVFGFLGVEPDIKIENRDASGTGQNKAKPNKQVMDYLDAYFAGPNEVLARDYDMVF